MKNRILNYKHSIYIIAFILILLYCIIFFTYEQYLQLQYIQNIITQDLLEDKKLFIIFLLIFSCLITIYLARYFEKKIIISQTLKESYIQELEGINTFYNLLQNCTDLKSVSTASINFISTKFNALNGFIYLVNYKNSKLLLLDGYNIDINKTAKILDLYYGLAGEAFSTKKVKTYYSKNITYCAIPLISNNIVVGVIKLHFEKTLSLEKINNYQNMILSIVAENLLKNIEQSSNERYLDLIDKYVLLSSTNSEGEITYVSDAFCKTTGYTKKELLGNNHRMLRDPKVPQELFEDMWSTIRSGKTWSKEFSNLTKNGTLQWTKTTITPRYDLYENIIGYDAIRIDITDKKKIELLSITDSLTSLYNRRYFDKMFPTHLKLADRTDKSLALIMLDIDHFKQYNDTYGHQQGDKTLQKVASSINSFAQRETDYAFRIGGEEFALLLFVKEPIDALLIANNLKEAVEKLKIPHKKSSVANCVTVSMGLYICNNKPINTIYKEADDLLYKAKENGRNQVVSNITG